jgi:hypothetical protein
MGVFAVGTRNKVLDHVTGTATYAAVTPYLALYGGDPTGAGAEIEIPTQNGYNRQELSSSNMSAASSGAITNSAAITWGPATAAWGDVTYVAAFDAATGGNLLWYDDVATKTVGSGDSYQIAAGDLDLTLT